MKKRMTIGLIAILFLTGCTTPPIPQAETPDEPPEVIVVETPETAVETTETEAEPEELPPEETTEPAMPEPETVEPQTNEPERELSVADYFPPFENAIRTFKGVGIEYASYSVRTEYIQDDLVQFHNNNGGTETVNVFRVSDDEVRLIFTESENYSRLNRLSETRPSQERILIQGPLEVGHSWEDPVMGQSTIIRLDEPIVILGTELVRALVIESQDVINYFAPGYGLVKTVYPEHDISSTLDKIEVNTAYQERIDLVHLDDEARPMGTTVTFDMNTNESLLEKLSRALRRPRPDGLDLPEGFDITSITKEPFSQQIYVDITPGIYDWDVGATDELNHLKELSLTLRGYFTAEEFYLSVDGADYDSGSLQLDRTIPLK